LYWRETGRSGTIGGLFSICFEIAFGYKVGPALEQLNLEASDSTRHLIIATFTASLTIRHETMA
jgi:hypothetical protein